MYTELTKEERKSILGNENFKGTFVCCDSEICHYCARHHYPDHEFDDRECEECIHQNGGLYKSFPSGGNNFLGIECITWEAE